MKRLLQATLLSAAFASALAIVPMVSQAQVGVLINVGEPGFYGQINIGTAAPPPVIYAQPMIVTPPAPGAVVEPPMYLRVPEEHHKHWDHWCHQYNACHRKVYFVTEDWYHHNYEHHEKHEEHEHDHEHEYDHDHEHDHDHGHDHDHEHD